MDKIFGNDGPEKRFGFCYSRKLTSSEQQYSIFKLELIAAVNGLHASRDISLFRPIILFVDARSLLYVRLSRNTSEQIARLSIQLSCFDVHIFHVPSDLNLADPYTRLPLDFDSKKDSDYYNQSNRYFTEQESHLIINNLIIPKKLSLSSDIVQEHLARDSLKTDLPGKKTKQKRNKEEKNIYIYISTKQRKV